MPQLPRYVREPLLSTFKRSDRPPTPEDVTADPISSGDDESEKDAHPYHYHDSSGDDELSSKADLTRSDLTSKPTSRTAAASKDRNVSIAAKDSSPKAQGSQQRRSARQVVSTSSKKRTKDRTEDDEIEESDLFASKKKVKTASSESLPTRGGHMQDGWMVERAFNKPRKTTSVTYGSKKGAKSQNSTPRRKFMNVDSISDPVSPEPEFKTRPSPPRDSSSDTRQGSFKTTRPARDESSPLTELESDVQSDPPRPLDARNKQQKTGRRQSSRRKKSIRDVTLEPVSQRPEFKMPQGYDEYASDAGLGDLDGLLDETPVTGKNKAELERGKALCPMCEEQVEEAWLKDFSKGQRMTIARQNKFCRMHKKKSAEETWKDKGYPQLDWNRFETRIGKHHDFIEALVLGKVSHFGTEHKEKIKTGQNRTLFTTEDYPTPGYYGLRGMSLMTETIIQNFSSLLRERAPQDKLISARGYTGFVQSVLVPELAVKLIQEDMSLSANEARKVMEESQSVGEILHDDRGGSRKRAQVVSENSGVEEDDVVKVKRDAGESSIRPKGQEVEGSDSELSSLTSGSLEEAETESKAVSGTHAREAEDSDSDLSSLGDL